MSKREALAAYAHEAWAGWMRYMFSKGERRGQFKVGSEGEIDVVWIMPAWAVERWQRQMNTPYAELPESEKESDRAEADKMLAICDQPAAPDLYQALAFAKSVILSGEPWDETCEQVIDGALRKARGESNGDS